MAYIKTLKENELIGGKDQTTVYPISTTQAIYSQKPDGTIPDGIKHQKLEDRLFDDEEDARELHRKAEKLVAYIDNDKAGQTLEITGDTKQMTLTGSAQLESYGDEPAEVVAFEDMEIKKLTISSGSAILVEKSNWEGHEVFDIPNQVGQYKARFDVTYNGVPKYAETTTNMNLRKYVGFSDNQPENIQTLGNPNDPALFSNSIACTFTVPAAPGVISSDPDKFKHIYFAIPSAMVTGNEIHVLQPEALNAPLKTHFVADIQNSGGYNYKLFASGTTQESEDGLIDSSVSKRLTIIG